MIQRLDGHGVHVHAPVRVADVGGWADTWFGSPGRVCHLAVGPGVQIEARWSGDFDPARPVRVIAPDVGVDHRVGPDPDPLVGWSSPRPGTDRLLEHGVAAVLENCDIEVGGDLGIEVFITSAVPPGASLGSSAAVLVGIQAALDALVSKVRRGPDELARMAHDTETRRAGREAGVQDQWAAAFGGAEILDINPYPMVTRTNVVLSSETVKVIGEQLVTVVFGVHDSSSVHAAVITNVVSCDGEVHEKARHSLRVMSRLASAAGQALQDGDLKGWAGILTQATQAQEGLGQGLVGENHQRAIDMARRFNAWGWKVNGAGGNGGSLSVMAASAQDAQDLAQAYSGVADWQVVDLKPARWGTVVTDLEAGSPSSL